MTDQNTATRAFPQIIYQRSSDYSQVAYVGPTQAGWSVVNLCDYWDGLQGIATEAAALHRQGLTMPLRRLSVFVTDLCNMRCRDCQVDFNSSQSIDLGWLAEQFGEVRRMGAVFLDLMGLGEPTLLPGLPKLLETANKHGLICTIGTNGATANLRNATYRERLLNSCPLKFRVSLDSADADYHNRMRGGNPSWHRAVRFIQQVVQARTRGNLPISLFINSIVRASSLEQVYQNISFFIELGVDDVHLIPVRYASQEFCTVEQIQRYNTEVAPRIEELTIQSQMAWAAENAYIFGRTEMEIERSSQGRYYLPTKARDCYALKEQMVIDSCRRPFTCLWGKRAGGRPISEDPIQDVKRGYLNLAEIEYLSVNPEICQNYCTREVILVNDRIEELIHYSAGSDGST